MKKTMFSLCILLVSLVTSFSVSGQKKNSFKFSNKDTCYLKEFDSRNGCTFSKTKFPPGDFLVFLEKGQQRVSLPIVRSEKSKGDLLLKTFCFSGNVLITEIGSTNYDNNISQSSIFTQINLSKRDKKSFGKVQKRILKKILK